MLKGYLKNPYKIFVSLASRGFFKKMNDKKYVKLMYRGMMNKKLNLDNPKTFNEKIQWLKIYNRKPEYTKLVDKYEVKKYVAEKIGDEYIIPTIGVWDNFTDIDFSDLPAQFVLKVAHDSGGVFICKDKEKIDVKQIQEKIDRALKHNYFYWNREYPYKDVKPRIIAEEYLKAIEKEVIEYKIFCFNGEPQIILVCKGEGHSSSRTNDFYDLDFKHIPVSVAYPNASVECEKPNQYDELITLAKKLAKGILQVRVDFYIANNKIYFGEMTFFHESGYCKFNPEKYDEIFGNMISLPKSINS